ncbi:MAG TPA: head completion/stabilization protein [Allosphingosinicella sp.]|uniref:head completion/stabilization protein n=1 Tax=Allosphingosinicella sp. TaxID=2823234 RepID=UPI002ED7D1EB
MSDLVCQPSIVPPSPAEDATPIVNDGWFPDVNPALLKQQARIHDSVTAPRLEEAVLAAIITVNNDLAAYKAEKQAAGHATLAAVPSLELNGESRLQILYRRAIASLVKAELIEKYRDFDQTGAGQRDTGELDQSIGALRRDATHAIRDILGRGRTTVELL